MYLEFLTLHCLYTGFIFFILQLVYKNALGTTMGLAFPNDTSACGLEESGIDPPTLHLSNDPTLPPEPQLPSWTI